MWDTTRLCFTIQYAVDEMSNSRLFTGVNHGELSESVRRFKKHAERIIESCGNIQMYVQDGDNHQTRDALDFMSASISSFYENSFCLFADVDVSKDIGFTTLVSVFQEHQNTLESVCRYLKGLNLDQLRRSGYNILELDNNLPYISTTMTGPSFNILDAILGTIMYAATCIDLEGIRSTDGHTGIPNTTRVHEDTPINPFEILQDVVLACATMDTFNRVYSSFTEGDEQMIRELHQRILQVHVASIFLVSEITMWIGIGNSYMWKPQYERTQRLLVGACRQLEELLHHSRNAREQRLMLDEWNGSGED